MYISHTRPPCGRYECLDLLCQIVRMRLNSQHIDGDWQHIFVPKQIIVVSRRDIDVLSTQSQRGGSVPVVDRQNRIDAKLLAALKARSCRSDMHLNNNAIPGLQAQDITEAETGPTALVTMPGCTRPDRPRWSRRPKIAGRRIRSSRRSEAWTYLFASSRGGQSEYCPPEIRSPLTYRALKPNLQDKLAKRILTAGWNLYA